MKPAREPLRPIVTDKKRMGRPPNDPPIRATRVYLDDGLLERARLLGAGNVSRGIREALRRVRLPFEANPAPTDAGAGSPAAVPEVSSQ